jgi:uncharacterized repeat protein (TIGR01451 family)
MKRRNGKFSLLTGLFIAILTGSARGAQTPAGAAIVNTAFVSYDGGAGTVVTRPSDTVITGIRPAGVLEVVKTASRTVVSAGDTLAYEITARNAGTSVLTGVAVRDSLPAMLSLLSSLPAGTLRDGVVEWAVPRIEPGQSVSFRLVCRVGKSDYVETIINSASISADGAPARRSAPVPVRWLPWSGADLSKTVSPRRAFTGDTLTYTLTVRNTGVTALTRSVVRDTLPEGLNFVSSDRTASVDGSVVLWPVGDLPRHGEARLILRVRLAPDASAGSIVNRAVFVSSESASDTASAAFEVAGPGAGIRIKKYSQDTVYAAGQTVTYHIVVHNPGLRDGGRLAVRDTLPPGLIYVSSSHFSRNESGVVVWSLDGLKSGSRDTLHVMARIRAPMKDSTRIDNVAWALLAGAGQDSAHWKIRVDSKPAVKFEKTASAAACAVGDSLDYTLTAFNGGTVSATAATVTDTLPEGLAFVSSSLPVDTSRGVVTWTIGSLDAQRGKTLVLRARVTPLAPGGRIRNTAWFSSRETGKIPASASVLSIGWGAGIEIVKLARDSVAAAGDTVTYSLILRNPGSRPANGVMVRDTLPPGLTYVSASDDGRFEDGAAVWNFFSLGAGSRDTLRLRTRIDVPARNGLRIENIAWAYSAENAKDSSRFAIRVVSKPGVSLDKKCDRAACAAGDTLTWVLTAANTGTEILTAVAVTDTLPAGLTPLSSDPGAASDGGILTWNVGALGYRQSREFRVRTLVSAPPAGDTIRNTAVLSSVETGRVRASASVAFRGGNGGGIDIIKRAKQAAFWSGDTLTYDLIVSNGVTERNTSISIRDTLNPALRFLGATHGGGLEDGNVAVWNLRDLAADYHDTLQLTVTIPGPIENRTFVDNRVWAVSSTGARDSSAWGITVFSPPLLNLDIFGPRTTFIGDTIRYRLVSSNVGEIAAFQPILTDTLPDYLEFVGASGDFSFDASARTVGGTMKSGVRGPNGNAGAYADGSTGAVVWRLPDLKPGDRDTVTLDVRVTERLGSRTDVSDIGWLTCVHTAGSIRVTDASVASLGRDDLFLYETVDRPQAVAGDTLAYLMRFGATKRDVPGEVRIVNVLPSEVRFIPESVLCKPSVRLDVYDPISNRVEFTVTGLTAGEPDSIGLKTLVRSDIPPGLTLISNASNLICGPDTLSSDRDARSRTATRLVSAFLSVRKTVNRKTAEGGEALTYTVTCTNLSAADSVLNLEVLDRMPEGFRYQPGSTRFDSTAAPDPAIGADGKRQVLRWRLASVLKPSGVLEIRYRVLIGLSTGRGEHENRVTASGVTPDDVEAVSDEAKASVLVSGGAFDDRGLIIGKVFEDHDGNGTHGGDEPGARNVELILEDGTRVRTDEYGKYSIPDVEQGQHVLRLNEKTLPAGTRATATDFNFLDDPKSRLVQVPPGGMAKANFTLEKSK